MMMNLFSTFDPTSSFNVKMNWISTIIVLLFIVNMLWNTTSRMNMVFKLFYTNLSKEIKTHLKSKKANIMFITIMTFIMFNNLMGLTSYTFTSTSHILLTLSLALPLWTSLMLYGWINKMNHMFMHLVPQGTPSYLMPFMVLIETISNMIRPITLSVRLAANMIAGHLLLTLLGNQGNTMLNTTLPFLISLQIMLLMLETAVAIIQSYVFTILSTLYTSEVN
uniref:ATP synthase subunit a n=1 Tax=Scolopendra dehaani TaxID=2609776 RepID=A0A343JML3_SCODE|nr:ATP synthase F0 subunit 6 [Scolopendra dehaani]